MFKTHVAKYLFTVYFMGFYSPTNLFKHLQGIRVIVISKVNHPLIAGTALLSLSVLSEPP